MPEQPASGGLARATVPARGKLTISIVAGNKRKDCTCRKPASGKRTPMSLESIFEDASVAYRKLQDEISAAVEQLERGPCFIWNDSATDPEAQSFQEDSWSGEREGSMQLRGGGRTRVLEAGRVFERAGVNFSDVSGTFSEELARSMPGESREFRACGISLVLHPRNPYVPTVHANFRVIRRGPSNSIERMWFGGGADLTPYFLNEEDARHFHRQFQEACRAHPEVADYAVMKAECDRYFYLAHRGEARGIGGIFYDYRDEQHAALLRFSQSAGAAFLKAYQPIVEKRRELPYGPPEREFQLWRRGRYVEFNLIYDRGTLFGLRTGGRIESILMSLPPMVAWRYDRQARPGSPEEELLGVLRKPVDWV